MCTEFIVLQGNRKTRAPISLVQSVFLKLLFDPWLHQGPRKTAEGLRRVCGESAESLGRDRRALLAEVGFLFGCSVTLGVPCSSKRTFQTICSGLFGASFGTNGDSSEFLLESLCCVFWALFRSRNRSRKISS